MRPILTLAAVKTAIATLKKQKKSPSCLNLHIYFGGRGSTTTVNKLRREALQLPALKPKAKTAKKGQAVEAGPERTIRV